MKKAILLILDSVGIGAAPDAAGYGDAGANTLLHTAASAGGLRLPCLQRLGLGNIPGLLDKGNEIAGVPPAAAPEASFGVMREVSCGKDTTTGHWEMAGLELKEGFRLFPGAYPSFPAELIGAFEAETRRKVIGNKAASGTVIIEELGPRQMRTGEWIVYTSSDSVMQIAAHEEIIPPAELYRGCEAARRIADHYRIGRVIARPYHGRPGGFRRTAGRRDYSYPMPEPSVLERLEAAGVTVTAVGKIEDIFNRRGITRSFHTAGNADTQAKLLELGGPAPAEELVFANLIDFDMLYGHRRDAAGYAAALEKTDQFLEKFITGLGQDSILIITADHGNDPTFRGTDHTREFVPLLVFRPGRPGKSLGIRNGFYDVAQSLAAWFGIGPMPRGQSFLFGG